MSENDNNTPSKQTSSVPLKKETVRVTLNAADMPSHVPSATLPATPAPTVRPPIAAPVPQAAQPSVGAPTAPTPPAAAATVPLRAGPPTVGPPTVGAPTIKLATSNTPVGAPTIALKTANTPLPGVGAPTIALRTANTPSTGGAASTIALPKATVALNPPTKPHSPITGTFTNRPTLSKVDEDEDETGAGTFAKILAGVGLVAALVVLGIQLKISNIWIEKDEIRPGDWSLLLE